MLFHLCLIHVHVRKPCGYSTSIWLVFALALIYLSKILLNTYLLPCRNKPIEFIKENAIFLSIHAKSVSSAFLLYIFFACFFKTTIGRHYKESGNSVLELDYFLIVDSFLFLFRHFVKFTYICIAVSASVWLNTLISKKSSFWRSRNLGQTHLIKRHLLSLLILYLLTQL